MCLMHVEGGEGSPRDPHSINQLLVGPNPSKSHPDRGCCSISLLDY